MEIPVYSGRLEISREDGGLVLVNELYLEDYLKHVVPSEMPVSYEKEALKARLSVPELMHTGRSREIPIRNMALMWMTVPGSRCTIT